MAVDNIVQDPESIDTFEEAEAMLNKILVFKKDSHNAKAGVLMVQRRQFRGLYIIGSDANSRKSLERPIKQSTCEWGLKFYFQTYFEEMKKMLNEGKIDYNALEFYVIKD